MLAEWLCHKQTGYILNEDGSWSPHNKPPEEGYAKDWCLSVQVRKVKAAFRLFWIGLSGLIGLAAWWYFAA